MKKLVFAAVAAIALTASVSFVSCDPKQPVVNDTIDSVVVEEEVEAAIDSVVDSLVDAAVDSVLAE